MSLRLPKLKDLLRDEVGRILQTEFDFDNGVLVTVVNVFISPTLEHANIFVSVYPKINEDGVIRKINAKIYFLQQILNKRLAMRPVPKVRFEIDRSGYHATKIEKILQRNK